ncbi:MAG: SH3 domain-containing protein, partial [Pirellulales bacterium]
MRLLCLTIGIGLLGSAHTVHAEPSPPYTAYVSADDVYVRSGPGSNYYPTDKLSTGAQVEVYRHDSGGWYAIRPPKNSFSWVSSRYVEPTENGLGRVTDQRAVARVGSRFSNVRDVIQIRLDKGETVEILGERNVGGQTWYKIAPPSGEFRWMSGRFLDHRPPSQRAESTSVAKGQDSGRFERPVGDEPRPAEWSTARRDDTASAPETASRQDHLVDLAAADDDQTSPAEVVPESGTEGPISDLNRINHALSVMVAEEPSVWELSEIKHQTEAIARQARTNAEREDVNRLLHKIARLEDIKARHDRLMPSPRVTRAGRSDPGRDVSAETPESDGRTHWRTSSSTCSGVPSQS